MPHFDMLICNGCVVDGTGAPPFAADVAVLDGRIAAIGHQLGSASQTIDATGLLVTPALLMCTPTLMARPPGTSSSGPHHSKV